MSLRATIHKRITSLKKLIAQFFRPQTNASIRRLQIFWLISVIVGIVVLSYGGIILFFGSSPSHQQVAVQKQPEAKQIESGYAKAGPEGAWRYTIDTALEDLKKTTKNLQEKLEDLNKNKPQEDEQRGQEIERRFGEFEINIFERLKGDSRLREDLAAPVYPQGTPGNGSL